MKYIIASQQTLMDYFPHLDLAHARRSLTGGLAVVEEEIDADTQSLLELDGALVFTHTQAFEYLNSPESLGVWYEAHTDQVKTAPEFPVGNSNVETGPDDTVS